MKIEKILAEIPETGSITSQEIAKNLKIRVAIASYALHYLADNQKIFVVGTVIENGRNIKVYSKIEPVKKEPAPDVIECAVCKNLFMRNPKEKPDDFARRKHCNKHKKHTNNDQDPARYYTEGSNINTLLAQLFLTGRMDCQRRKSMREAAKIARVDTRKYTRKKPIVRRLRSEWMQK